MIYPPWVYRVAPVVVRVKTVTQPTEEPISLEDCCEHLRIDPGVSDHDILAKLTASREYAEGFTGVFMATRTVDETFASFADTAGTRLWWCQPPTQPSGLQLAAGPVTGVVSVTYQALDGTPPVPTTLTLDPSAYQLVNDDDDTPPTLQPADGTTWPTGATRVVVRYTVGYDGASAAASTPPGTAPLPGDIRAALLLLLGHFNENREAVTVAREVAIELPFAVEALLRKYRIRLGLA